MSETIQTVIQNNNWNSVDFLESTDVNRMIKAGIITGAGKQAKAAINAVEQDNVQSTVVTGLNGFAWQEQNFGDASENHATPLEQFFEDITVKTYYGNMWWKVANIQQDLLSASDPTGLVKDRVGKYWATMWNRIIAATISGMKDISEITIGDGSANLSAKMVLDARILKGDMGFGKLATMYMNSATLFDILAKQVANTITTELITEKHGQIEIVTGGIRQLVRSPIPEYVYGGVTPIVIDDAIASGVIGLLEQGAFAFAQKDIKNPIKYKNDPTAGLGAGMEMWGVVNTYMLHPLGFSFKGTIPTDYASKSGLSLAELQGGGLYELVADAKLAPITILYVKIGA